MRINKNKYMFSDELTKDLKNRLKSIKGHIESIIKMLENDEDPEKISNQFKAVDAALQKAYFLLLDEVYRKVLAMKIVKAVDSCPGNCGNEEKINYLLKEFPNLKLDEITSKLKEIIEIEERLKF